MKHSIFRKLILIAVLLTSSHAFAYDFKVDGLEYNILSSNTCEIVNSAYMSTINIPSGVVGSGKFYTVVGIADNAFSNNSGLESVTIPKTITQIGIMAFYACSKLKSIVIDKENIFYDSRDNCNAIIETATNTLKKGCTNTIIPESVTSIGDDSFYNCRELISISIPNSITSIGDGAFASCGKLNSVTIPNSVTNIAINAFTNCYSVNSIIVESENTIYDSRDNCNAIIETATNSLIVGCKNTIIPSSVTSIGDFSFYECSDLTSIKIPNSVTSIGTGAFYRCSGLTSVTIPNSVTSIGSSAFQNCVGLTSITIPNSVTSIGNGTFSECSGLTSITIPNSVTSIKGWTFSGCESLTTIVIPNSVTSIGERAFQGCYSLVSITIPNSVKTISDWTFSHCKNLISVTIPESITTMGNYIFRNCPNLSEIISESTMPAIADIYTFDGISTSATLYVPVGAKEAYANATGWKNFTNIIEDDVKTGVESTIIDNSCVKVSVEYYNLNGVKVKNPEKGIFIKRQGRKVEKIVM